MILKGASPLAILPRLSARTLASSLASLSLVALLALAGCATSSSGTSEQPAIATATSTTAAPTATSAPTTCAQVPGFAGAGALSLPNMELPAGAVAASPTTSGGGTGQFSIASYTVCVPNNTTSLTVMTGKGPEPFLTLVLFYGWGPIGTFPTNGQVQAGCGGAKCFNKTDEMRFLAVDQVTALSNGLVTFRLRHATPPPAPACNGTDFPDTTYHLAEDEGSGVFIPLPPLSREGMGQGAAGSTYIPICSAGTPASINAFFQQAAPAYGWQPGLYGAGSWQQVKSGRTYSFSVTGVTSATNWTLRIFRVM